MHLILIGLVVGIVLYCLDKAIRSRKVGSFSQKYVFITGCDSGFGHQLAIHLDGLGFPVFAGCLTDAGQKNLSEKASSRLVTLTLDVTDCASIKQAYEYVQSKLPQDTGLWAIVNNAGISGPPVPVDICPMDEFRKVCEVNMFGPVEICRTFLPLVRKTKEKGRIVNIVSVMGRNACAHSAYCTSKFGMEGFSDCLRRDLQPQGVKVSIIEPGFFLTNILDRRQLLGGFKKFYDLADEEVKTAYGKDFVKNGEAIMEEIIDKACPDTNLVVEAYTHAIVSQYPRTRYVVGWDACLMFIPLTWLPAGVADWIIMKWRTNMCQQGRAKKQG